VKAAVDMHDDEATRRQATPSGQEGRPGMQFPLRTLLLASSGVAVAAAILGPAYRAARPEARPMLLAFWSSLAAITLGYLWFQWRGHVRRLTAAGPIRFSLPRYDHFQSWWLTYASVPLGGVLLTITLAMCWVFMRQAMRRNEGSIPSGAMIGAYLGFLLASAIHFIYRPRVFLRPILLGEEGIVVRRRVLPWSRFKRASWHHLEPHRLTLYASDRGYSVEASPTQKEEIEALVRMKTEFEKDERKLGPGF
jgi:hypothetical protein